MFQRSSKVVFRATSAQRIRKNNSTVFTKQDTDTRDEWKNENTLMSSTEAVQRTVDNKIQPFHHLIHLNKHHGFHQVSPATFNVFRNFSQQPKRSTFKVESALLKSASDVWQEFNIPSSSSWRCSVGFSFSHQPHPAILLWSLPCALEAWKRAVPILVRMRWIQLIMKYEAQNPW